jgi:hypothetical protein
MSTVNLRSHPRFSVRRSKIGEVENTPPAAERLEAILGAHGLGDAPLATLYTVQNISAGGALWGQMFGDTLKLKGKPDLVVVPTNTAPMGYAKQLRVT